MDILEFKVLLQEFDRFLVKVRSFSKVDKFKCKVKLDKVSDDDKIIKVSKCLL